MNFDSNVNYNKWEGNEEEVVLTLNGSKQNIKGQCLDYNNLIIYLDYAKNSETSIDIKLFIKPDNNDSRRYEHPVSKNITTDGLYRLEWEIANEERNFDLEVKGNGGTGGTLKARYLMTNKYIHQ